MYEVLPSSQDRWLFINHEWSTEEIDSFIDLLEAYRKKLNGRVVDIGDTQYIVNNDPYGLIFQWDSCFGNVVIVPAKTELSTATEILKNLCDTLNS